MKIEKKFIFLIILKETHITIWPFFQHIYKNRYYQGVLPTYLIMLCYKFVQYIIGVLYLSIHINKEIFIFSLRSPVVLWFLESIDKTYRDQVRGIQIYTPGLIQPNFIDYNIFFILSCTALIIHKIF